MMVLFRLYNIACKVGGHTTGAAIYMMGFKTALALALTRPAIAAKLAQMIQIDYERHGGLSIREAIIYQEEVLQELLQEPNPTHCTDSGSISVN